MKLDNYSEIVGTISDFKLENDNIHVFFTITKEIEVPQDKISKGILKKFQDKKISIINVDGEYKIRELKKQGRLRQDVKQSE